MKETLERAWAHAAWANGRVAGRLAEVDEEEAAEALRLFTHLVWSERVWLDRIREGTTEQPIWPEDGSDLDLGPALALAVRNAEEVQGILTTADAASLAEPVAYENSTGTSFETPLGDILLHVALHGAYHRGQVARALRGAGSEPVNTDYITFVREG